MKKTILIGFFSVMTAGLQTTARNDFPALTGPYLGQKPPGRTPLPFASSVFDSFYSFHNGPLIFSPDGDEAYWQARAKPVKSNQPGEDAIFGSAYRNGRWTPPRKAAFSKANAKDDSPFISPDGKRLYFLSGRFPGPSGGEQVIFVAERKGDGWSDPEPLPLNLDSGMIFGRVSVDRRYDIYFAARNIFNKLEIYRSRYDRGEYSPPEKLGGEINAPGSSSSYAPFVAPDGNYLIFARFENQATALFICYRRENGAWTSAKDLGEVLGNRSGFTNPFVTADGKFLFFQIVRQPPGYPEGYGWVDAGFIADWRPR